jgi:hypothetical protein
MQSEVIRLWTGRLRSHGSIPGGGKRLLVSETSRPVLELYPTSFSVGSVDSFWGLSGKGVKMMTRRSLMSRLRMIGNTYPHYIIP